MRNIFKAENIIVCLIVVMLCFGKTAFAKTLTITNSATFPPFSFLDDAGKPQGLFIDLWNEWAKQNKQKIKFVLVDWNKSLELVRSGEADIHAGLFKSAKREKYMDFSDGLFHLTTGLFVSTALNVQDITDLKAIKIGVTKGGFEEGFLRHDLDHDNVKLFDNNQALIKSASNGDITAFVADYPVGMYYLDYFDAQERFRLFKKLYSNTLYSAVKKGDLPLITLINSGMQHIDRKEIERIEQKWIRSEHILPPWFLPFLAILGAAIIVGGFMLYVYALKRSQARLEKIVIQRTADLQEGRDQLNAMIICAMDGIIHIDTRGIVRSFNPASERLFGYGEAEIIGRNISILMPEPDRSRHDGYMARYLAGGEAHIIGREREVIAVRKDGSRLTIALHVNTMLIKGDHYFIGMVRDVTDRKQADTVLRQAKAVAEEANKAKSRFLSAASHDLRQPLQALRMFTEILASDTKGREQAKLFANIQRCQHTIQSMLDSLLDISRLDAGMLQTHIETVAVPVVFEHMQSGFAPLAEAKDMALFTRCPRDACIQTDPILIERILGNLLGNAIRYTEEGGMVLLACRRRGNHWRLEVRDSGAGIAEQDQVSIFEEFHQLDNPEMGRGEGLGLGLAIVKRLCALLEHDIELYSRLGLGATFAVTASACAKRLVTRSEAVENSRVEQSAMNFQLGLVIDDDPLARDSVSSGMRAYGYTVRTAANQQQAEQLVARDCPDFIVCDYRLPGDNGIGIIRRLWRCIGRRIPSVLLTGDTTAAMRMEAEQAGIPVVTKPSGIEELFSALRKQDFSA